MPFYIPPCGRLKALAVLLAAAGVAFLPLSCTHDAVVPDTPTISFKEQVQPIFVNNCAKSGCHDGSDEFSLKSYTEISSRVHAGDARKSELYKVINKLWLGNMPPDGPLTDEQINLIYTWIMQGAKNN